jgi:uroporphyrinogen-III synthase
VRLVVTRPPDQAAELCSRLEARGHEVAVFPLISIEPLGDTPIDPTPYDWVVVTSRNGARELARRLTDGPRRVAAIGPGTAEELRAAGIEPELVPAVSTQEGLLAAFPRPAGRVLFAGAEGARLLLAEELAADFLPLYRTRELAPADFPRDADLVLLASASAARAYAGLAIRLPAVSIGPQTTAAARAGGVKIAAEATTHDTEGLIAAVDEACSSRS